MYFPKFFIAFMAGCRKRFIEKSIKRFEAFDDFLSLIHRCFLLMVGSYAARFLLEGGITKLPQNHAPGMAKTRHLSEALLASGAPDKWQ